MQSHIENLREIYQEFLRMGVYLVYTKNNRIRKMSNKGRPYVYNSQAKSIPGQFFIFQGQQSIIKDKIKEANDKSEGIKSLARRCGGAKFYDARSITPGKRLNISSRKIEGARSPKGKSKQDGSSAGAMPYVTDTTGTQDYKIEYQETPSLKDAIINALFRKKKLPTGKDLWKEIKDYTTEP